MALTSLWGCDPDRYEPHPLHDKRSAYSETNCYSDLIIELLHARGDEPLAVLGCLVATDFEGDQFTFLKPPPEELRDLFGVDIHEMQPYRSLTAQALEQLEAGRTMTVEVDSWWLPDTASTSYRREHVKTSIALEAIDDAAERLHYFHAGGLYALSGEDFRGALRVAVGPEVLPPYTELVRFDAGTRLLGAELRAAARDRLQGHLSRRPKDAFARFGEHLLAVQPELAEGTLGFHDYAFATVRMVGSAATVGAGYARWLLHAEGESAASHFDAAAQACTALSFRLARRRAFEVEPAVEAIQSQWDAALEQLDARVG
ncbi:MAG: hypothetical protein QOE64_423 [Frankiales bacterium]|nr:hypothetical protein [Frankiales bacterium]